MKLLTILFASTLALSQAPASTKAEQLQDAARKGDAAAVKALLDGGLDVNTKFRYGVTAIFFACDAGQIEVVKVLLDRGADLTVTDTFYGMQPLALAVSPPRKKTPAHNEIAKLLIAKGAPGQDMALIAAVSDDDEGLTKVLLDKGGLPPDKLSDALEVARADNKAKTAALLEKAGAKPYDDFKIEPAQLARFAGTYKSADGNELVITVHDIRLWTHNTQAPPEQHSVYAAKDATTFRRVGPQGTTLAFSIEGDKVTGFAIVGSPTKYTRVEGK